MSTIANTIYQSGEQVPQSATYQVVGANENATAEKKERAIRTLHVGEIFPSYEGQEVCWHTAELIAKPEIAGRHF
jgi:hypothetical protein